MQQNQAASNAANINSSISIHWLKFPEYHVSLSQSLFYKYCKISWGEFLMNLQIYKTFNNWFGIFISGFHKFSLRCGKP